MEHYTRYLDNPTVENVAELTELLTYDLTLSAIYLVAGAINIPIIGLYLI